MVAGFAVPEWSTYQRLRSQRWLWSLLAAIVDHRLEIVWVPTDLQMVKNHLINIHLGLSIPQCMATLEGNLAINHDIWCHIFRRQTHFLNTIPFDPCVSRVKTSASTYLTYTIKQRSRHCWGFPEGSPKYETQKMCVCRNKNRTLQITKSSVGSTSMWIIWIPHVFFP